ncbi:MAG: zinc-dependent metalloprotease [Actinomycetota bacterium]|nr:zinc-dependent metalloprotease [Actinomycetota bacterium]
MPEPTGPAVGGSSRGPGPEYVDWEFAKATGRRLVNPGPTVSGREASEVVASLRAVATAAREPIASTSRLHSPDGAAPVFIVDRPGWIDANVDSMRSLLAPVIETVAAGSKLQSSTVTAVGAKVTGAEAGALLSFLASKVLGQYDLAPQATPRLLLVAPNIVQVERELDVDPQDFRLWVAMHEETHRVQFTAVPWLREHLVDRTQDLGTDLAPNAAELASRLGEIARRLPEAFQPGSQGVSEIFLTAAQRDKVAQITAVMSLLEGHADVMMDEVGPAVIPTVAEIRRKFQKRRGGTGSLDRFIRRALGLEAKMRQYQDGATFVRSVVDRVGLDDFNAVWTSPETLPTPDEIGRPERWVERVHGR